MLTSEHERRLSKLTDWTAKNYGLSDHERWELRALRAARDMPGEEFLVVITPALHYALGTVMATRQLELFLLPSRPDDLPAYGLRGILPPART
jgi:hypothetical protein